MKKDRRRRKKKKKPHGKNILSASATQGGHNYWKSHQLLYDEDFSQVTQVEMFLDQPRASGQTSAPVHAVVVRRKSCNPSGSDRLSTGIAE